MDPGLVSCCDEMFQVNGQHLSKMSTAVGLSCSWCFLCQPAGHQPEHPPLCMILAVLVTHRIASAVLSTHPPAGFLFKRASWPATQHPALITHFLRLTPPPPPPPAPPPRCSPRLLPRDPPLSARVQLCHHRVDISTHVCTQVISGSFVCCEPQQAGHCQVNCLPTGVGQFTCGPSRLLSWAVSHQHGLQHGRDPPSCLENHCPGCWTCSSSSSSSSSAPISSG
jgi:hypothetical protein